MGHFTRSLNHRQLETRAGTPSRSRGWKGQRTNNAPSRSIRRSGHSILASAALGLRAFDRNLICGEHYGQRPSKSAASTGRTHGCTDQLCITVHKSLANREPTTHGYKQTSSRPNLRSALPLTADIAIPAIDPCSRGCQNPLLPSAKSSPCAAQHTAQTLHLRAQNPHCPFKSATPLPATSASNIRDARHPKSVA